MPPILKLTRSDYYRAGLLAAIDTALLLGASALGLPVTIALPLSLLIATHLLLAINPLLPSIGYWRFLWIAVLILFLRGAIWTLLNNAFGDTSGFVIPLTAILSALLFVTALTLTTPSLRGESSSPNRSNLASLSIFIVAYMLLLRLLYLGILNVIPEEAYYWNYGQHLDWGYLDHPPMVGWLSRLGTALLGHHEFGVRLFALISWCATGWFSYRFTKDRYGRNAALAVLVMLSTLPFFIGVGSLMMPDAPLTACWAGAIFFLNRALFEDKVNSWYGVGICLGLGLLSKYTIGLLVPATFLFMLWDKKSRIWLVRPQPYLALMIAALLFSPVIWWNAHHEWISFAFQTTRRWGESIRFSPHLLLGSILVLLTPAGLWAAAAGLKDQFTKIRQSSSSSDQERSFSRFVLSLVLVPLAVFTLFSLTHEPKLNWTGPLWLALLPVIGAVLYPDETSTAVTASIARLRRASRFTAIALVFIYGAALYWAVIGIPGVPYLKSFAFVTGWSHLSEQITAVEQQVKANTGEQPLIVGMNRYFISSEIAFYDQNDGPSKCAGRHLFGDVALMYRFWFPEDQQTGKNIIVVAETPGELETLAVTSSFDSLTLVQAIPIYCRANEPGSYWYRIGFGYKKAPSN